MCASAKVKYINPVSDPDVHFTFDKVYEVLSISVSSGTPYIVVLNDIGKLVATHLQGGSPSFELVSISVPSNVQIYP